MIGPAVPEIVPIHRGDYHVPKASFKGHDADMFGFKRIDWAGFSSPDVTERAGSRANFAQDHYRRMFLCPTLADIGAACFLADRVQLQVEQQVGDRADPLPLRGLDAQPLGLEHG